jgi:hypothetical protein
VKVPAPLFLANSCQREPVAESLQATLRRCLHAAFLQRSKTRRLLTKYAIMKPAIGKPINVRQSRRTKELIVSPSKLTLKMMAAVQ